MTDHSSTAGHPIQVASRNQDHCVHVGSQHTIHNSSVLCILAVASTPVR